MTIRMGSSKIEKRKEKLTWNINIKYMGYIYMWIGEKNGISIHLSLQISRSVARMV
jgi:hypothetical protein